MTLVAPVLSALDAYLPTLASSQKKKLSVLEQLHRKSFNQSAVWERHYFANKAEVLAKRLCVGSWESRFKIYHIIWGVFRQVEDAFNEIALKFFDFLVVITSPYFRSIPHNCSHDSLKEFVLSTRLHVCSSQSNCCVLHFCLQNVLLVAC